MRLLLIRHGQTTSNVSGALDTAFPGAGLTDLGQRQARAAARHLQDREIEGIFVSTLQRTHQTAAPLQEQLGIDTVEYDGLREIAAGDYEMKDDHESVTGYLTAVGSWIYGDHDHQMLGGETGHEFLKRYDEAIANILDTNQRQAALFSHGAAIRTWVAARAAGIDHGRWADLALSPLNNTGAIELEWTRSGWEIVDWSNDPIGGHHLEDPLAEDPTAG